MKILFAYNITDQDNDFVSIHIEILHQLGYDVTASLDEFWQPTKSYGLVVINWPEVFFGWKMNITDDEVAKLNSALLRWNAIETQLLTFFHDEYSHFGRSANLNLLFDLCYRRSDFLIHLGGYSKNKYTALYTDAQHYIIYHPLYTDFQTDRDKNISRQKLGVSQDTYLVFVPGGIRKTEEIDYCLEVYRRLPVKNRQLIFQKTNFLARPRALKNFTDLKVWVYYLLHTKRFKLRENISFLQGFMDKDLLAAYFAASDVVIIPRTDILNSGNILLAAQFGKPMIGSGSGNMGELLRLLGQQCLPPNFMHDQNITIPENNPVEIKQAVVRYANNEVIKKQWQQILKP
ncbi:hypothetical protein FIC_00363 [Flavobacteriaceae bacterium 3519-10]|nr:hypothetical protein FIC_00363 [Flavobacteriaceae bacterium 3519-10]